MFNIFIIPVLVLFILTFLTTSFEFLERRVKTIKKELELISPGTLYSKLLKLVSPFTSNFSMGILELLGNIKDTQDFLQNSTIFCFPSLWEGYPNALVEAISAGLPIILTNRLSKLNDFVETKYNGIIVSDKDYLRIIISMLSDRDKLNLMSKRSYEKYQKLYKKSSIKNWIKIIK